jgi:hypothetical protein
MPINESMIPNNKTMAKVVLTPLATRDRKLREIVFFPYDFEIDDVFRPEWGTYDGFGKMDPIMTFKRTSRTVNLSFNVVAENTDMAEDNFNKLQSLIQGLYPVYKTPSLGDVRGLEDQRSLADIAAFKADAGFGAANSVLTGKLTGVQQLFQETQKIEEQILNINSQNQAISDFGIGVIDQSPLFQISFMNLLNNEEYVIAITNFKHKFKFDAADTTLSKDGKAIPGEFNINMAFTVLHTYVPGTKQNYNVGK